MCVEKVAKYDISKMLFISYICLRGFINDIILNFGSLVDNYNDRVVTRILWVSCYGLNNLFKLTQYFFKYY